MRKLIVLLGVLSLSLMSCGGSPLGGTETGNPSDNTTPGGVNGAVQFTKSGQILTAICNKLTACHSGSLTSASCISGVEAVTNLGSALGITGPHATDTYQNIINIEASGTIPSVSGPATTCISDIQALPCTSAGATSVYAPGSGNFNNVVNMIPTSTASCAGVF